MEVRTRCCVVGGGPAGLMLSLLLARAGVEVMALEKHADFLRDFRGDTIHPRLWTRSPISASWSVSSSCRIRRSRPFSAIVEDQIFQVADFRRLKTKKRFIALMPQWDFLDFLAGEAARLPNFTLFRRAQATELLRDDAGRVTGVEAQTPEGPLRVEADLVVGADGRHSTIRKAAGFEVETLGAPMDVMWFRVSRAPGDGAATAGRFSSEGLFIAINRGDYWQCALVIPKGGGEAVKAEGIEAFRARIGRLGPFPPERAQEIESFDQTSLLSVAVDRLDRWHAPGLLVIGDAAHAMSPIGGVGVNVAIQDAIATANLLAEALRRGPVDEAALARVQARRMPAVRVTQAMQLMMQNNVVAPTLASRTKLTPPLPLRLLDRFRSCRAFPRGSSAWACGRSGSARLSRKGALKVRRGLARASRLARPPPGIHDLAPHSKIAAL
ncbi:FAD-dependent oxidoreductase [Chenggangzhangella methanolivorans]|uniref:FAD-dependent oxidoreductase n=1 Tax=Chenggangzhangella methanolivorans TaxID=1437009 RepID=A0A9E6RC30_9HYPH|nr:FAD-dependent oxidoreductase [Chenggangzhangella methanolivorans]QZN98340.1 FAD-dependent oxidoreductase [Chenggangzhangella methanolivorans]